MKHVESNWAANFGDRGYRALDQARKDLAAKVKDKNQNHPRFQRFVSIVDLRDDEKQDDEGPKLYVFEPSKKSASIHKNPSALNFFHNSKRSIIPKPDPPEDALDQKESQILTATTTGPQVTVCALSEFLRAASFDDNKAVGAGDMFVVVSCHSTWSLRTVYGVTFIFTDNAQDLCRRI